MSRQPDATLTLLQLSNLGWWQKSLTQASLLGNNSVLDPPDPIPNSEVKWNCADDSVGSPHVKVGHCQALISKAPIVDLIGAFSFVANEFARLIILR